MDNLEKESLYMNLRATILILKQLSESPTKNEAIESINTILPAELRVT